MKRISLLIVSLLFSLSFYAQNIDLDKSLGKENAAIVEAENGIYDNADMTNYLQELGDRLVAQLDEPLFEYQFHIIPDPTPNAFALPGGYIYITTGLLPIIKSEDELACIIGHEIIHSNNRHTIRQLRKSIFPKLLEVPGNLLGIINKNIGALINAPITTSNSLLFASYSRKYETEADEEGIKLAAKAGYNPEAMISSLTRLSEVVEIATGSEEKKSYFNDHPYTPTRAKNIREEISDLKWKHKQPISENFIYEFDGVLFGQSPEVGVIRGNKYLHPSINFTVEFPVGWNISNQPDNIGAVSPKGDGAIFVTLENPMLSPTQAADKFVKELKEEDKSKIVSSEIHYSNGKQGHLVSFNDEVNSINMYAYVLWIPLDDKLFKLIGIAPIEYKDELHKTALSLRVLNSEEKKSFIISTMKVVKAKENETIITLSTRENNILNAELTKIINSKDLDSKLKKDELIKIIVNNPYSISK